MRGACGAARARVEPTRSPRSRVERIATRPGAPPDSRRRRRGRHDRPGLPVGVRTRELGGGGGFLVGAPGLARGPARGGCVAHRRHRGRGDRASVLLRIDGVRLRVVGDIEAQRRSPFSRPRGSRRTAVASSSRSDLSSEKRPAHGHRRFDDVAMSLVEPADRLVSLLVLCLQAFGSRSAWPTRSRPP